MGEFSGGEQGVATFYCAAHGVSPITMSADHPGGGGEDTRSVNYT